MSIDQVTVPLLARSARAVACSGIVLQKQAVHPDNDARWMDGPRAGVAGQPGADLSGVFTRAGSTLSAVGRLYRSVRSKLQFSRLQLRSQRETSHRRRRVFGASQTAARGAQSNTVATGSRK